MRKRNYIFIGIIVISVIGACMYIADIYKFYTTKITIHYDIDSPDGKSFDITDREVIKDISAICVKGTFKNVPKDKMYSGLCSIFIDFNNGIVVGLYNDIDYGNIEKKEKGLSLVGRPVYLPEGLNAYVSKLIEENRESRQ